LALPLPKLRPPFAVFVLAFAALLVPASLVTKEEGLRWS
jgi:hypothetical protein